MLNQSIGKVSFKSVCSHWEEINKISNQTVTFWHNLTSSSQACIRCSREENQKGWQTTTRNKTKSLTLWSFQLSTENSHVYSPSVPTLPVLSGTMWPSLPATSSHMSQLDLVREGTLVYRVRHKASEPAAGGPEHSGSPPRMGQSWGAS